MMDVKPNISYRRLTQNHIAVVEDFINRQLTTIPADFFFPPNKIIIERSVEVPTGISHAAFDGDELIGIRLTYKPELDKENHGYDLGYSERELNSIAQFHGTIVKDDTRYKGIGYELVKINCAELFKKGFEIILATVHPENYVSINMLLKNGFEQKKLVTKYSNLPRYIFEKRKLQSL